MWSIIDVPVVDNRSQPIIEDLRYMVLHGSDNKDWKSSLVSAIFCMTDSHGSLALTYLSPLTLFSHVASNGSLMH